MRILFSPEEQVNCPYQQTVTGSGGEGLFRLVSLATES